MSTPHDPVLPDRGAADADEAWGEAGTASTDGDAHDTWLREQRPPHHDR